MIAPRERTLLRDLATQVAEAASQPIMAERVALWKRHNSLQSARPMILVFPEGSWREILPEEALHCKDEEARRIERALRMRLVYRDHIPDDTVIEKEWSVPKVIENSGWGLEGKHIPSAMATGAYAFDPVLHSREDLRQIRFPVIRYNEQATHRNLEQAQELFGDLLDVRLRGVRHVSFHLMRLYIDWRGIDQTMWDMYDHPDLVHETMALLEEGYRGLVQQYVAHNLLDLNNDGAYHSSGGVGYSDELPQPDYDPARIRPSDMWASAEAQELAQVSPAMHAEFVLQYEKRLLEPFGLTGYGCCEDLSDKMADVLSIPHIRRISISPFASVERCAAQLGRRAIFSWKPHPAHLVGDWQGERVRAYLQRTIQIARQHGCVLEMVLKDTHTCEHHPERFTWWTEIARELVET